MGELGSMGHWFAPERYEAPDFVLRSYDAGDGSLVAAATRESYEHLRPWMSWATEEQSVDDAEISARRFRAKYLTNEDFLIGAFSRDGARLLGGTGFHLREGPLSGGCAEIGMWVRASEAGRGLGTRLLGAMLSWGFSEWPWLRLAWRCDDRNRASMRVAEKCGLRLEGLLRGQAAEVGGGRRDTASFAITRDEWLARQPRSPAR
ncbi:MAG TPA: GNAT family protein [Polyangiaceae bacterium]|nr:GNAT family protein [Polyangiaceae bacterium]